MSRRLERRSRSRRLARQLLLQPHLTAAQEVGRAVLEESELPSPRRRPRWIRERESRTSRPAQRLVPVQVLRRRPAQELIPVHVPRRRPAAPAGGRSAPAPENKISLDGLGAVVAQLVATEVGMEPRDLAARLAEVLKVAQPGSSPDKDGTVYFSAGP